LRRPRIRAERREAIMTTSNSHPTLTRRALVAGASAGAAVLAADPALAQRCPAKPPARTRGPNVWLELDQQDLDEAYDQSVYAFNASHVNRRRSERSKLVLGIMQPQRLAYGPSEIEKVDIYRTRRANAPTFIYLHGGAWRSGSTAREAYVAEPYVNAGANVAIVEFNNVRETKGDLMPMVDQCRRAVAWVYRNAKSFGGNPDALYLSGFSSGGHLGGCVVITEWEKQGLPRNILKGALLGSGMYDLKPVRMSARSSYVKFTDEIEQALSAIRHLDKVHTPLVLTHGTLDTPEFQRQTRDFAAALTKAGKPVKLIVGGGHNHFEMVESLGNPYGVMGRAAMEMMKLTTVT
jgi:arylformamidase